MDKNRVDFWSSKFMLILSISPVGWSSHHKVQVCTPNKTAEKLVLYVNSKPYICVQVASDFRSDWLTHAYIRNFSKLIGRTFVLRWCKMSHQISAGRHNFLPLLFLSHLLSKTHTHTERDEEIYAICFVAQVVADFKWNDERQKKHMIISVFW